MAGRIYSSHFLSAVVNSSGTASSATYTVPADKMAIVRTIDIFLDVAGTMLFGRTLAGQQYFFISTRDAGVHHVVHWEGRQVFDAGGVMSCLWVSGQHRITVSGYLLDV